MHAHTTDTYTKTYALDWSEASLQHKELHDAGYEEAVVDPRQKVLHASCSQCLLSTHKH